MATHSNILAWNIPWAEAPSGLYSPYDQKESDTTEEFSQSHSINILKETCDI